MRTMEEVGWKKFVELYRSLGPQVVYSVYESNETKQIREDNEHIRNLLFKNNCDCAESTVPSWLNFHSFLDAPENYISSKVCDLSPEKNVFGDLLSKSRLLTSSASSVSPKVPNTTKKDDERPKELKISSTNPLFIILNPPTSISAPRGTSPPMSSGGTGENLPNFPSNSYQCSDPSNERSHRSAEQEAQIKTNSQNKENSPANYNTERNYNTRRYNPAHLSSTVKNVPHINNTRTYTSEENKKSIHSLGSHYPINEINNNIPSTKFYLNDHNYSSNDPSPYVSTTEPSSSSQSVADPSTRKRKKKLLGEKTTNAVNPENVKIDTESEVDVESYVNTAQKRRRGRPRKSTNHTELINLDKSSVSPGSSEALEDKKKKHNANEKQRRDNLTANLHEMRDIMIPDIFQFGETPPKRVVLENAIRYLNDLEGERSCLQIQLKNEKVKLEKNRRELNSPKKRKEAIESNILTSRHQEKITFV